MPAFTVTRTSLLGLLFLLSVPAAFADSCQANFKTTGDPRNGATYLTYITIPDMDIHSAIGQMEKIAMDDGFLVGGEDYKGTTGTLILSQKQTFKHKGFPLIVTADKGTGHLGIGMQLNQGQFAKQEDISNSMCGMLAKVKMGSEGAAVAAEARAATHTDEIISIKAVDLAIELAKKMRFKTQAEPIEAQYLNRTYRIDGQVSRPVGIVAGMDKYYEAKDPTHVINLLYITQAPAGLLGIGQMQQTKVSITCRTAPEQFDRFAALQNGNFATLIGKVVSFDGSNLFLNNCKFAE